MRVLPPTLQTTYSNLLQVHLNRPAFDFEGAPFMRELHGKSYWYANQRIGPGAALRQRYLGPDNDELRVRIESMREQSQNLADFRKHASALVGQLRAGGVRGPDRQSGPVLRALANSGVFRLGGTLVGTHAFRLYDLVLGAFLSEGDGGITETDDIDIASFAKLAMAVDDVADPELNEALGKLKFKPRPSLNSRTPTSWTLADNSYAVDFLTPSFEQAEEPVRLASLCVWAQSLHYLNFLIKDPIPAVAPYMEGLLVQIPRPERYAVHKLIVSQVRHATSLDKRNKDIAQAGALIGDISQTNPHTLYAMIAEADATGEKWRKALDRALNVSFEPIEPIYNGERDVIRFRGVALGQSRLFGISGEALDDFFGANAHGLHLRHETAVRNRSKIEALMRWKFRTEPSLAPLVTSDDLVRFQTAAINR